MRRFGVVLLAVATLMAWSVPATAKGKPPKPLEAPTQYTVEITFQSNDGLATTCAETVEVTRTDGDRGRVSHYQSEGATLSVEADGLNGNGYHLDTGCHGSHVAPEYFRITLEDALEEDGSAAISVAMLWIFDVEVIETITPKNGRQKTETIRTDFRMGGPYEDGDFALWNPPTITTTDGREVIKLHGTGLFSFVHFQSGGHQEIDGDPLFVEVGTRTFTLDVTLTETG
jgi:hypothetical protein